MNDKDYLKDVFYSTQRHVWETHFADTCGSIRNCNPKTTANDSCTNNLMGSKGRYISPLQAGRMHRNLSMDKKMMKYTHGYDKEHPYVVTKNESWDFYIKFYQDVIVKSGVTLEVNCDIVMEEGAKIIVEPGATLNINGGKITSCVPMKKLWGAIEVLGDATKPQQTGTSAGSQGKLLLTDATLSYARNAITTGRRYSWGVDKSTAGGIIIARNSVMHNCGKAVEYLEYANKSGNSVRNNRGLFQKCSFFINRYYPEIITPSQTLISLDKVMGVTFSGCTFQDNRKASDPGYQSYTPNQPITGITAMDAGFTVNTYYDAINNQTISCSFNGLEYGIISNKVASAKNITIDRATFKSCGIGVFNRGIDNMVMNRNVFDLGALPVPAFFACRALISNATLYQIEENTFKRQSNPNTSTIGLFVHNTGPIDNMIYKNTFQGVEVANCAWRNNRSTQVSQETGQISGLQYICNINNTLNNDIMIADDTSFVDDGIRFYQGVPSQTGTAPQSAGNIFTNGGSNSESDIYNHADMSMIYSFSDKVKEKPVYYTSSKVTFPTQTSVQNSCISSFTSNDPPRIGGGAGGGAGGGTSIPKIPVHIDQYKLSYSPSYNQSQTTYRKLLDNGNTDALINSVTTVKPNQSLLLKQQMLMSQPWLSASVLQAAINRPDVFNNLELYTLLKYNPDALHYQTIFKVLEAKTNLFTMQQIEELHQAANTAKTARTELERSLALNGWQRNRTAIQIAQSYLPTEEQAPDWANYRYWIEQLESPAAHYLIADSYMEEGDYATALAKVNEIETKYKLSVEQKQEQVEMVTLLKLLLAQHSQGKKLDDLDVVQKASIIQLADNGNSQAAQRARNLLCWWYGTHCEQNWELPKMKLSRAAHQDEETGELQKQEPITNLQIVPNPATNCVNVYYSVQTIGNIKMVIYDLLGRVMYNQEFLVDQNVVPVNTNACPKGAYQVFLFQNNAKLMAQRLLIH